jgi:hypothetical protein
MHTTATNTPNASAAETAQKKTYRLELQNGHAPQLNLYIKHIMKDQDLNRWSANPEGFNQWLRTAVAGYMRQVSIVICTR